MSLADVTTPTLHGAARGEWRAEALLELADALEAGTDPAAAVVPATVLPSMIDGMRAYACGLAATADLARVELDRRRLERDIAVGKVCGDHERPRPCLECA